MQGNNPVEPDEPDDLERLARLHRQLLDQAERLLADGDHSLAMQMIKHNGVTAPRRDASGAMEGASKIAAKLNFRPRQRLEVVKESAG